MYRILSIIFLILIVTSCSDSSDIKKRDILDDDEFLSLLVDMHKAEGIISASNINLNRNKRDSVSIYNSVLKKHNVSRLDFNITVKYYTFHTDEYLVFYDSISSYLKALNSEIKSELEKERKIKQEEDLKKKDTLNLWRLKQEWILPDDGEKKPIAFKIQQKKQGQYKLRAMIKVFRDDKSVNQRMTIIANYADGTKDLNSTQTIVKDGKFEVYTVSVTTDKKKELNSVSGWLLDHSKNTGKKHAHVKEITLKYNKETSNSK